MNFQDKQHFHFIRILYSHILGSMNDSLHLRYFGAPHLCLLDLTSPPAVFFFKMVLPPAVVVILSDL